jgi:hypothetical protein
MSNTLYLFYAAAPRIARNPQARFDAWVVSAD